VKCLPRTLVTSHFRQMSMSAKQVLTCLLLLLNSGFLFSQHSFYAVSSVYDNTLGEWVMDVDDAEGRQVRAEMRLKWPLRDDPNEWVVDFDDRYYSIKLRWQNNPIQWEMTGGNQILTIRQKWRGDPNIWIINYGDYSLTWQTLYPNLFEEWFFELDSESFFEMWTRYEFDIRDWDINDKAATIPDEVKIAAIFTTVYISMTR